MECALLLSFERVAGVDPCIVSAGQRSDERESLIDELARHTGG